MDNLKNTPSTTSTWEKFLKKNLGEYLIYNKIRLQKSFLGLKILAGSARPPRGKNYSGPCRLGLKLFSGRADFGRKLNPEYNSTDLKSGSDRAGTNRVQPDSGSKKSGRFGRMPTPGSKYLNAKFRHFRQSLFATMNLTEIYFSQ